MVCSHISEEAFWEVFRGSAQLCFGVTIPWDSLHSQIYIGRRWYDTRRFDPELVSQALADDPYDGESHYSEFHNAEDLQNFWMSPNQGTSRPPGVKSWKGLWLKYHLPCRQGYRLPFWPACGSLQPDVHWLWGPVRTRTRARYHAGRHRPLFRL